MSRSANFMSGSGQDPLNPSYGDVLKTVGQAIPGAVANAAKNEVKQATTNPGNYVQRLGGHAFNVVADTGQMVANTAANAGNAVISGAYNAALGAGAGFASGFAGHTITAQNKDLTPFPNVKAPKLDTTPGNKVWQGGSANYDPKVGTVQSLGVYVPGDPFESVSRTFDAAGTALLPVGGVVSKPLGTAAKSAVTTTAKGAAKAGKAAAATPAGKAAAKAGAATADVVSGATKAAVQGAGKKVVTPIAVGSLLLTGTGIPAKASVKPAISVAQVIKKAERATDDSRSAVKLPEETPRPSSVPDGAGKKVRADANVDDVKHTKAKNVLDTLSKADSIAPAVAQDLVPASAQASGDTGEPKPPKGTPKPKEKPKPRPHLDADLNLKIGQQNVKLQRIN
jgi:hypothetical protein